MTDTYVSISFTDVPNLTLKEFIIQPYGEGKVNPVLN